MVHLVLYLKQTPISNWQKRLGTPAKRLEYYETLTALLRETDAAAQSRPQRQRIVEEVGRQSASTLYAALRKLPLVDAIDQSATRSRLEQGDIVDRLLAETQIWSYHDHRLGWMNGLSRMRAESTRMAATTLLQTVALWAAAEPALASSRPTIPPLSAAQDLCLVVEHHLPFDDAVALLERVITEATGPLGISPDAVVDAVYDELMRPYSRPETVRDAFGRIRSSLRDIVHVLDRMSEEEIAAALPSDVSLDTIRRLAKGA
ncbi:hypothetical protein ABGB12_34310 [Actinocorallia sp. B10E7]|uniref:hypothetical protein n=1 Tax=Actinocorallia sp. B10E7 TaxID=3153558 RepID=UPI00325D1BC6